MTDRKCVCLDICHNDQQSMFCNRPCKVMCSDTKTEQIEMCNGTFSESDRHTKRDNSSRHKCVRIVNNCQQHVHWQEQIEVIPHRQRRCTESNEDDKVKDVHEEVCAGRPKPILKHRQNCVVIVHEGD